MRLFEPEQDQEDFFPSKSSLADLTALENLETSFTEDLEKELHNHKKGFLPVFKNRRFLVLWSGQIFSQLADKVYLVLTIALIASHFQGPNQPISGWVSAVMIAFTIPAVLFGSLAGVYVDRWLKKDVLVLTNLLRGGLVLIIPPLLWISNDWGHLFGVPVGFGILLAITFLVSTFTQFFAPAEQATIPLILPRGHLLAANSLYTTTMMALLIIGFAVGQPLLDGMDYLAGLLGWGMGKELLVGGSYTIAGFLLLLLKTGETKESLDIERPHVLQDIWDGILYLKQNHPVRNALIQLIILFCVFAALAVLAVPLADTIPGMRPEQFGFLLAAGGVGMAIGATAIGHGGQKFSHNQLSLWGSGGMAFAFVGMSLFTHSLWLELASTAFLGGFAALVGVPMQTTIQAETPEEMRGKVFGLQNNAINIALSVPLALAGVAETFWGLKTVFLVLGLLVALGGLLTWLLTKKTDTKFKKS